MTKTREIYRCTVCGNVVEVVNPGAMLSCCGQPMKLMKENTTDAAKEKHVPVIEPIEGGYRVKVGSVEHPMLPEHYIQWIELLTPTDVLRHELQPGEKPEVIFQQMPKRYRLASIATCMGCGKEMPTHHLTMNTIDFGYVIPAIRVYSGLAPVRQCSCRAY